MVERIVVNVVPAVAHKRRYQEQQRALWLVKVGHDVAHNVIFIARCNDNLRSRVQHRQVICLLYTSDAADEL